MIALDTNVLVHAHTPSSGLHQRAYALIVKLAVGPDPWGIPVFAVNEFLKVITHRGRGRSPMNLRDAITSANRVVGSPSCNLLAPGPHYWRLFAEVATSGQATGPLLYDAAIVAVCREHGARTIVSNDRDLRRFDGITAIDIEQALAS